MVKHLLVSAVLILCLSSCASRKDIAYFQNISESENHDTTIYEPRFQPDDLLMIIVSASDAEAAAPFNLHAVTVLGENASRMDQANSPMRYQTYLVDNEGFINFPIIGSLKIGGLTRKESIKMLETELEKYIKNPIVNLRNINFKVSVIGEVSRPGTFSIETERITLPEAISLAGDMTIYGGRNNVLIIREVEGRKTHTFVDMTQADFINSDFYYLSQNDLIYVEPNKTKMNASTVGPNITVAISAISLLITIVAIVTR